MSRTWKSRVIRAAAKLLAVTVTATSCLSGMAFTARAEGYGKNGTMRDISSQQLVEDMGLGYNIGNTFDSIGSFIEMGDPWDYQKGWGNDPVSQHFIQKIKESGFKTIRLPVSWAQWLDENNQINPGYMQAVQTVVDWCMDEDMYVIINIHHDGGGADTAWIRKAAVDWDWTSRRYEAIWSQISENFKNYGDHLIFEGMNEIEFPAAKNMSEQYDILNRMNQLFVDTVRRSGGNNAQRHLMIPGYNTDIRWTSDRRYHMPEDPANHSILSIHYYSPSAFCVADRNAGWAVPRTTWGTQEDIDEVEANLNILAENFLSKGVPIIIGEYGVLTEDDKDPSSIQEYLKIVPEIIMQYGMCPVLWDTSNAGDMKFVERVSGEFYDPVIKSNYQQLAQKKASGQIVKKEFYFPEYQRVSVPIASGGWVSLDAFEPEKIQGIAFELECASDWDSYGGGGIYLDGWDNTIQYQFTSVYDEVKYMFTESDKARLKDQLGVFIWWTDESNGGNRRDELSIKGQKITLLYGENERVSVPRVDSITGGFRSSGGSGGGGSRTPNHSTDPSGGSSNGGTRTYQYVLKQSRQNAPEGDNETGVQRLDVQQLCPGYQVGDKIRISVEVMSDGGYSFAAQASEGGTWLNSDSWGPDSGKTVSWECTPDDGQAAIYLWYLGGSYLMFNVNIEIVEKAKVFGIDDVAGELTGTDKENEYRYHLGDVLEAYQVEAGKRIRLTIYPEKAEGGEDVSGKVWFLDKNGVTISSDFNTASENGSLTLVGTPKDGNIYFALNGPQEQARAVNIPTFKVKNIRVEQLPDLDVLAEILGITRVEIPSGMVNQSEGKEEGAKVYFEYDGKDILDRGAFSANLVINNDWDFSNDKWEIRTDANGTYIWYPGASNSAVTFACWYSNGASFRITNVELVKDPGEAFPEFTVSKDKPVENYSFAELLEKKGIAAGSRIKLTVSVKAEGEVGGSIGLTEKNGTKLTGVISGGTGAVLIGSFEKCTADFQVNDDSASDTYTVTDIQVEKLDGNAIGEFQKAGRIEFASSLIEKKEIEGLEKSGLKVYYQYDGDITKVSSNLVVNGDWGYANGKWIVGEDSDGTYIWYDCESAGSVLIGCWYIDQSWKITKLVHETKKGNETEKPEEPTPPDAPTLKDNEAEAELKDGKYYVPEGKGNPTGMRYTGTNLANNGTNINANGSYWGWKEVDKEHTFEEGKQIEYLEFFPGDGGEITSVIFIYSDDEPTSPEKPSLKDNEAEAVLQDGKYYVPEGKGNPTGMRYTGTNLANNGTNINANGSYWGWKEVDKEHTFEEGKQIEYLEFFPGDGGEITSVIFIFSDTATTSLMNTLANSMLYRKAPFCLDASDEEIFEVNVAADEDGYYYLPEEMDYAPIGIYAEVSSDRKDVTIVFDDEESKVTVTPENKKIYYFFSKNEVSTCIQFQGQKVKNVTFLYWNGEEADAAEDGVFVLPDYRIPAAVRFSRNTEERKKAAGSLFVEIYDRSSKNWKEEEKVLTRELSVKADGTGWYVFTEKNQETLTEAFEKAKAGYAAPRLRFVMDGAEVETDSVIAYYNVSYTDDMEITEPEEEEVKPEKTEKEKKVSAEKQKPDQEETKEPVTQENQKDEEKQKPLVKEEAVQESSDKDKENQKPVEKEEEKTSGITEETSEDKAEDDSDSAEKKETLSSAEETEAEKDAERDREAEEIERSKETEGNKETEANKGTEENKETDKEENSKTPLKEEKKSGESSQQADQ